MYVTHLSLHDFRSYGALELQLGPGVTSFIGRNGQGKTNIVEAIDYLSRLSSHRVASEAPLVRLGATTAVVRAAVVREDRRAVLEIEISPGRSNRARINKSPLPRARELIGLVRTVLFSPEDLSLVKGDPSERRRFADDLLVLQSPKYAGTRADYDRVLKQRNTLLKTASMARRAGRADSALATLEVWDARLAGLGAEIISQRLGLVAALQPLVGQAYEAVARGAGRDDARLSYRCSFDLSGPASGGVGGDRSVASTPRATADTTGPDSLSVPDPGVAEGGRVVGSAPPPALDGSAFGPTAPDIEAALFAELERRRKDELDRGVTLVGPHRDDITFELGDHPVKGYASHGESWSFALALRLAAYQLLRESGDDPVLILDDVFAELDTGRRAQLAALVADAEQVLITAAVPEDIPAELSGARYLVADGAVTHDVD